jgi:nicotinate phosphoribosyltransferase
VGAEKYGCVVIANDLFALQSLVPGRIQMIGKRPVIDAKEIDNYTDHYFVNSRTAVRHAGVSRRVLYQVFQRENAVLCGMKYVFKLLSDLPPEVEVHALEDASRIGPKETVLHIAGPVDQLLVYETIYLGLLARMTRVATNVREAVEAAGGKPVLFFPARFDIPEAQEYDGYAARIGGATGASTQAEADAFHATAIGTMPHALIAAFQGDTAAAAIALKEALPDEPVWALVDFHNDSAQTAVEVYLALRQHGMRLDGIRLDTSQDLVDKSVERIDREIRGVQPELVFEVRRRLDEVGGREVKISVSGGFTAEKIRSFEEKQAPVDVYAVGERFLRGSIPFTSDIVGYYEGTNFIPCAKVGREFRPNPMLKRIK